MKIALVIPRNASKDESSFYDLRFASRFLFSKKYVSYLLAIPVLASLTPDEHEVRVFDENLEDIDYNWGADLVGISVRTIFANRAYHIADKFRGHGVKVVLGGIHPSMCLEEALDHADTVVTGEAEHVWQTLLKDVEQGKLKRTYKSDTPVVMDKTVPPKRSVLKVDEYFTSIVQTTKGCPFHCEFCSVFAYDGTKIRSKTITQVIDDIKSMGTLSLGFKKKAIFFADDNILATKSYAKKLFKALAPLKLNWSCQTSINVSREDELLRSMKSAGCGAMLIGLESVSKKNLESMDKGINLKYDYIEAIKTIQSRGIMVNGSFIVGYDFDTEESFDELIKFVEDTHMLMPLVNILTPFPGTKLFARFKKEDRLLHENWSLYDTKNVVFKPVLMSPEELFNGYKRVLKSVYSFDSIFKRLSYYWKKDFWKQSDPISFKYRLLFALRLASFLFTTDFERSRFILKILPKSFDKRVRLSTVITLMAYNDFVRDL